MTCLACRRWDKSSLCEGCRALMTPVSDRVLSGGLLVRAGFAHRGPARALVHRLKYEGIRAAAFLLAEAIVARWGPPPGTLVPVPRVAIRAWRLGIDPARELSAALAALTGASVEPSLRSPWWAPRRAGRPRRDRPQPVFGLTGHVPADWVLVDDVLTTGSTLTAAAAALGGLPGMALVATAAPGTTEY